MVQLTLRVEEGLAARLRLAASESGRSVNAFATAVLTAAVDPDLADDETERIRARLAQAGLLETASVRAPGSEPDEAALADARRRAGCGVSLAQLVADGRR